MYAELKLKKCPRCKQNKASGDYGKDATTAQGMSCWCKLCKKLWRSKQRKDFPVKHKARDLQGDLKKLYGISIDQYEAMRLKQKGCCACCGKHESNFKRRLHVDHDHDTGIIRALLCTKCNPGLGYFDHNASQLLLAVEYLNKFKK